MKSCFPKRPSAFAPEVRGLGAIGVAGHDFLAGEVTAIGEDGQAIRAGYPLRLPRHVGQLVFVVADVGDLVRDDQMVFGIHHRLHVVADHAGAFAVGAMARASGSVSET
jgi:hypothetical protein